MAFTLILSFPLHDDMDKLRLHSEIFLSFPAPVHLNGRYNGNSDGERKGKSIENHLPCFICVWESTRKGRECSRLVTGVCRNPINSAPELSFPDSEETSTLNVNDVRRCQQFRFLLFISFVFLSFGFNASFQLFCFGRVAME